jgi:hypothetical protein
MHGASISMNQAGFWGKQKHGAYAWIRNMERKAEWSMHKHGASRCIEQAEIWSGQKHGIERSME